MWKGGEFLNGLPVVTKHFGYIVLTYSLIFIRFLASSQTKPYSLESDFRIERVQIKTVDIHQLTNPVITLVSSLDRNRWLSAVRCLYYINIESVRRQTLWDQLTLFLRDTFLPVTSPV